MKILISTLFAFSSLNLLAAPLVVEAKCEGRHEGERIKIEAFVNPMNWCEPETSDTSSVIIISSAAGNHVYRSTVEETETEETVQITHSSANTFEQIRFTYSIEGIPGKGQGNLLKTTPNETTTVRLKCVFPEYDLDC